MSKQSIADLAAKVEQVGAIYAKRCGIRQGDDWYALKLVEEVGELNAEYLRLSGRGRTKGKTEDEIKADLGAECADVMAHLILFAKHNDIDLEEELRKKWFAYLENDDNN